MAEGLGERIRDLRKKQGKSLRKLAAQAGLSANHLSEIERDRSSPTVTVLIRLARALHRDSAELLLEDLNSSRIITRKSDRTLLCNEGGFSIWVLGQPAAGTRLGAFLLEISDGGTHRVSVLEGSRLVCLYSLSGKARVEVDGGPPAVLSEGASLQTVVSSTFLVCGEGGECKVLAFVTREAPTP